VRTQADCGSSDDSVRYYKCDITSSSAVSETAAAIRRDVGTPSILINNAGVAKPHNILDTSEEFLEKVFRVNLLSHWITIKEFLPAMLDARKGHIVSIASMASYSSCAGLVDYAATKAGVLALHEGMSALDRRSHPLAYLAREADILCTQV
jgi:all-trans-retinol dehydrogenase (NAD+)